MWRSPPPRSLQTRRSPDATAFARGRRLAARAAFKKADGEGLVSWAEPSRLRELVGGLVGGGEFRRPHRIASGMTTLRTTPAPIRARAYLRDVDPSLLTRTSAHVLEAGSRGRRALQCLLASCLACRTGPPVAAQVSGAVLRACAACCFARHAAPPRGPIRRHPHTRSPPDDSNRDSIRQRSLRTAAASARRSARPAALRGHDHSMWVDELIPALRWVRDRQNGAPSLALARRPARRCRTRRPAPPRSRGRCGFNSHCEAAGSRRHSSELTSQSRTADQARLRGRSARRQRERRADDDALTHPKTRRSVACRAVLAGWRG